MVDSSHTQPNKWSGSRSDAVPVAVWSDLSKIFVAIR